MEGRVPAAITLIDVGAGIEHRCHDRRVTVQRGPGERRAAVEGVFVLDRPGVASLWRTAASLPERISSMAGSGRIVRWANRLIPMSSGTIVAVAITSGRKIRMNRCSSRLLSPRRR
jgi:hypothetical protein